MADTDVKSANYANDEGSTEQSLSGVFDKCLELHRVLEYSDSTSEKYKTDVAWAISQLEEATRKVNMLSLFSRNETIDEVATGDIKYLLLPALLGSFTMKKNVSSPKDRSEILSLAELYFADYLQRLQDYEVSDTETSENFPFESDGVPSKGVLKLPEKMLEMASQRDQKIARFKRLKELGKKEEALYSTMKNKKDDEVVREYSIVLVKKWALIALEEITSIKMEKEVLQHFSQSVSLSQKNSKSAEKPKPLKPVIITRNELQKKVYGLGYPSLPVMTVDEFYQQRYPEHAENGPAAAAEMSNLMYRAANPEIHKKELEQEDEEKERKIETDDPELLQYNRDFDDWKDVNARGSGNRKNKG